MTSKKKKIGRVILDNEPRDIFVPADRDLVFEFSRYSKRLATVVDASKYSKIAFKSEVGRPPFPDGGNFIASEIKRFQESLYGMEQLKPEETIITSPKYNDWKPATLDLDIIANPEVLFEHNDLDSVLDQLGLPSLALMYAARSFGLETKGDQILGITEDFGSTPGGRVSALEKPVIIDGQLYFIEVKGGNHGVSPIDLSKATHDNNDCWGGFSMKTLDNAVEKMGHLNKNGYDSCILLGAYIIPDLEQFDGDRVGLFVRAVKATPTVAHFYHVLPDVADSLGMNNEELAGYIVKEAAADLAKVWKCGIAHRAPMHEQNIRLGSISDFANSKAKCAEEAGIYDFTLDVVSLVQSSHRIYRKLMGPQVEFPSHSDYMKNFQTAQAAEDMAERAQFQDYFAHCRAVRSLIVEGMNSVIPAEVGFPDFATTGLMVDRAMSNAFFRRYDDGKL